MGKVEVEVEWVRIVRVGVWGEARRWWRVERPTLPLALGGRVLVMG